MADWLPAIVVAAIAASGSWLLWFTNRRSADKRELREQRREISRRDQRELRWRNYAQTLRDWIYAGKPPPPPEWPLNMYEDGSSHDDRDDD